MANTVIAVYEDFSHAQSALNELLRCGFERSDVRLSPSSQDRTAREVALNSNDLGSEESTGGWSIGNFFRTLFGNDEQNHPHANLYKEAIRRGGYLLTVDADDEEAHERASEIMDRYQPVDIDARSEHWKSQGWSRYDSAAPILGDDEITEERARFAPTDHMPRTDALMGQNTAQGMGHNVTQNMTQNRAQDDIQRGGMLEGEARIPIVEEEMQVGKREVERGGVRVFQRVSEKPVQEQVSLREEHVKVERHPVGAPMQTDMGAFQEGSIEVRTTAEEAVIGKVARVVEEVVVSKETSERTQTIEDTVRRTDVEVEQLGAQANMGRDDISMDDTDFRSHWQTSYAHMGGRYEDYAPAYRYGSVLAGNERYLGSRWNDVEPQVRSEWESNNAGHPWEKAKDAVRYGWEKMTK